MSDDQLQLLPDRLGQPHPEHQPLFQQPSFYQDTYQKARRAFYYPFIPTVTLLGLVQGRVGWRNLASFQWRFWMTIAILCYLTLHNHIFVYYFQRTLNSFREVCHCDAIRLIRSTDLIEGAFLISSPYPNIVKYLICRSVCF